MDTDTDHWLYTLHFLKENDGFILGGNVNEGFIHYTSDGAQWAKIPAGSSQWLYGCTFPNSSNGFVVGYNGKIFKLSNFYIISPNGNEIWPERTTQSIEWVYNGDINHIKIEYSTDNGSNWISIINSTPSVNKKYLWHIPNTHSSNCRVKISDVNIYGLFDISDHKFSITEPVPVELSKFSAQLEGDMVQLFWITVTETQNYGFEIERKEKGGNWQKVGFIPGYGNSNSPKEYSYTDSKPYGTNSFYYRLKQIDVGGNFEYSDIVEVNINLSKFVLNQNYPNPFNPNTNIKYTLPKQEHVSLKLYDILGNEIKTLVNEVRQAGIHEVAFEATGMSSGVYFYLFKTNTFSEIKKMILMR